MAIDIEAYARDFFKMPSLEKKTDWEKVFRDMAVHTRKRVPTELLLKTRPNEEKHILDYRVCNYEAITYGSMNKALNSLFRIVSDMNYTITAPQQVEAYIEQRIFTGRPVSAGPPVRYTLEMWMENIMLKRFIEDPNGLLLWLPTGAGVLDSSVKVMPKPHLVYSSEIYDLGEDYVTVLSPEKSPITKDRKIVYEGEVYYILDDMAFYKFVQVGSASRKQFQVQLVYTHKLGEVPVTVLGGDMNADGYFESFFAPYLAFGNQAIRQFSDWQAIMVTSAFPYTEEFYADCEVNFFQSKSNPTPDVTEDEFDGKKQEEVNGLKPMPQSPYGVRIRRVPPTNQAIGEAVLDAAIPSRRYIYPDQSVAEYSGKSWEKLIDKAEDALHLNLGQLNQSGVAKEIDKEEHYAMVQRVADNYFDNLMLNSLRWIAAYLGPTTAEAATAQVNISKPASYMVKTEQDLVEEIGAMKEKKVPNLFISAGTIDLARKRFAGDPIALRMFTIIEQLDPLFVYDSDEKQNMANGGQVKDEQVTRSIYMYSILRQIAEEETPEKFLKMTVDQVKQKVDTLMAPLLPEVETPLVDENTVPPAPPEPPA